MARSVNCVHLIGNLTRDPELRYTASGRPVCDIGLATNRQWKTETGEIKEETEFHRIVLWGKLAEIAGQYLHKGERVYFMGRLSTKVWTAQDGTQRTITEVIAEDMMMLSSTDLSKRKPHDTTILTPAARKEEQTNQETIEVSPDEIPF